MNVTSSCFCASLYTHGFFLCVCVVGWLVGWFFLPKSFSHFEHPAMMPAPCVSAPHLPTLWCMRAWRSSMCSSWPTSFNDPSSWWPTPSSVMPMVRHWPPSPSVGFTCHWSATAGSAARLRCSSHMTLLISLPWSLCNTATPPLDMTPPCLVSAGRMSACTYDLCVCVWGGVHPCVSVGASLCGCMLVCLCGCTLVCLCGCTLVCLCGCILLCLCGCTLVCLCGCTLVCLCGCMLVCPCCWCWFCFVPVKLFFQCSFCCCWGVFVGACLCVFVGACLCVFVGACLCVCVGAHFCVCVGAHLCVCVGAHLCVCVGAHLCVCVGACLSVHAVGVGSVLFPQNYFFSALFAVVVWSSICDCV